MATEAQLKERIAKLANNASQVAHAVRIEYAAGQLHSHKAVRLLQMLDEARDQAAAAFVFADGGVLSDEL